jgi:hypothetical protein
MNPSVLWRVHFQSSPDTCFAFLATAAGRAAFWAESAEEKDGRIRFVFLDETIEESPLAAVDPPRLFSLRYFGALTEFLLEGDGRGGCDLTLRAFGVPERELLEVSSGWVSVLMAMKAAVDHRVDLRTHDSARSWRRHFVNQ